MTYVVAMIPARSGSSLKDKNIRLLAGHPLLAYSIRAALAVKNINRVIVSTNSIKYSKIAMKYGTDVPFLQPENTARDDSGDFPCIAYMLDWMENHGQTLPDLIVHLRPTTPLREPRIVSRAIRTMQENQDATSLRSVHEMSESAYKQLEIAGRHLRCLGPEGSSWIDEANAPRQSLPKTYYPNGYVDVLKTDFIRGNHRLHGNQSLAFITPRVTEVDTEEDFAFLEHQIATDPHFTKRLFE